MSITDKLRKYLCCCTFKDAHTTPPPPAEADNTETPANPFDATWYAQAAQNPPPVRSHIPDAYKPGGLFN